MGRSKGSGTGDHRRSPRWRLLEAARDQAKQLLRRRRGVLSVGIGQRHRAGRWTTGPSCVVVKVDWKLDAARLRAARRTPLPDWIYVNHAGRRRRVRVDVQETRGQLVGVLQGLVGARVSDAGTPVLGSVSAIVRVGPSLCGLVSGHVADRAGARLDLGGIAGTARTPFLTNRLDHCVVDPDAPFAADARRMIDDHRVTGIAALVQVAPNDVGYFYRAASGSRVAAVIRHVDMTAPFAYPNGVRTMDGLIATDGVTVGGDSGALLFDNSFRAIGTLLGHFGGESYFLPCEPCFSALGVALA